MMSKAQSKMLSNSRYHYIGSSDDMFDRFGIVIVMDCPYNTKEAFRESLEDCDGFLHEHFRNNVDLPSYIELTSSDMVWYDPKYDTWILLSDGIYHLFV